VAEPEAVKQAFSRVEPLVSEVQRYVRETLEPYCRRLNYAFVDRQKTIASLAEKLDGGRISSWAEVDRLAAQLKAAVEQVEVLIGAFDSASSVVRACPWPETNATATIIERCKQLVDDGLIPETLHPESWRRFADNVVALVRSYERDRNRLEGAASALLDVLEADLRGATPLELPVSGTLFQYVVSVVARTDTAGSLERFTVVPSRELSDLYGVSRLPRPFRFDGAAPPSSAGSEGEAQSDTDPRERS